MANKFEFDQPMKDGFNLFKENIGLLVGASLIATLLSFVSLLILAGPMTVGVLLLVRQCQQKNQSQPEIGEVFKGFRSFLDSFLFTLIFIVLSALLGVIPVLGYLISMALQAFYWWGIMFIAFEELSVGATIQKLIDETKKGDFFLALLFAILANLIAGAGVLACCIGVFFTIPLSYCMMVCCYDSNFGNRSTTPVAPQLDPSIFLK